MKLLFTERHGGAKPRTAENLGEATARGLLDLVSARINENWFGFAFPLACQDGRGNAGTDTDKLRAMLRTFDVVWPDDWTRAERMPDDGRIFDLIEFAFEHIAEPNGYENHGYWGHDHYSYDQTVGREKFQRDVNRAFERNGIAFELKDGEITRVLRSGVQEALAVVAGFKTGDDKLDELLEDARTRFLSRDLRIRKDGLEKLWDAWERLKTVGPGKDKSAQTQALIEKAVPELNMRARVEKEARELTEIGNSFMIRHSETTKIAIDDSPNVDYLFHRMIAMILLLLRAIR